MLEVTAKDINRNRIVTPGWYKVLFEGYDEKVSSKGDSNNHYLEGSIICNDDTGDTEFAGCPTPLGYCFSEKVPAFAIGLMEAMGETVVPGRIDLSAMVGKEVAIYFENGEYDGRIVNRINHKYRAPKS